jgi:hypothetical protein
MGASALGLMVIVAAIVGLAAQLVGSPFGIPRRRTRYDGLIVGVVAFVLGIVVSEVRQIGPQWDGLYVATAIFGAVFWGLVTAAILRYVARPESAEE